MAKPLYEVIDEHRTQIVHGFVTRPPSAERPLRTTVPKAETDALNECLNRLVSTLRARRIESTLDGAGVEQGEEPHWQAWRDPPGLVGAYGTLGRVILDVLAAARVSPSISDFAALNDSLHADMARAAREVTEEARRRVDDALEHAHTATRAQEDAMSIVAHDLKNPLNVVYGNVQELRRDIDGDDLNAKRLRLQRRIDTIQRAADRMNRLIADMGDLGRLKAGEMHLKYEPTNGAQLLREASEHLSTLAEQRDIELVLDVDRDGPLHCDRDRILQVLENLVGNAIKFSPVGGTVTLRLHCNEDGCTIEVEDSGPGIPEDKMPFLFQRYWQAPDTASRGTGLGLSIARGLVELHGGRIWAENRPRYGSTFRFTVPRAPKPAGGTRA